MVEKIKGLKPIEAMTMDVGYGSVTTQALKAVKYADIQSIIAEGK